LSPDNQTFKTAKSTVPAFVQGFVFIFENYTQSNVYMFSFLKV
jgi:hypothetical protein